MRGGNGVFTTRERKTAMWALLTAVLLAGAGLMIQQFSPPSVGPGGVDAYTIATTPGVVDARPVMDVAPVA